MLNNGIITASIPNQKITINELSQAKEKLTKYGWVLMRNFEMNLNNFSDLLNTFCHHVIFDPARETFGEDIQLVDAGTDAVGLHIENGNTMNIPDIVMFYSSKSAKVGSETTICDGNQIYNELPEDLKSYFSEPIYVKRNISEKLWKKYIFNEGKFPEVNSPEDITIDHAKAYSENLEVNQEFTLLDNGSIEYSLEIKPILIASTFAKLPSFANAILGPTYNYERPRYCLKDGSEIDNEIIKRIEDLCMNNVIEVSWNDGDVVVIDNKRVMHGRNNIEDTNRKLFIGMGNK